MYIKNQTDIIKIPMKNNLENYKNSDLVKGRLKIIKHRGYTLKTITDREINPYRKARIDKNKKTY